MKNNDKNYTNMSQNNLSPSPIERYILPFLGWLGLLIGFAALFNKIPHFVGIYLLTLIALLVGVFGHHILAMGWFDS